MPTLPSSFSTSPFEIRLQREALEVDAVRAFICSPQAGAECIFIGTTRDRHDNKPVVKLAYEAEENLALKEMQRLCETALQRFGLQKAALWHRLGEVPIGEASVAIAVSSAHRAAAFDGCRFLIDALKQDVPIWKKEYFADGSPPVWVGPDGEPLRI